MSTDHQTHGQPGLAVSQAPLGYNLQNIQALVSQNQQLQQSPSMNSVGSTHEGQQEPSQQQFCLRWNNFNSNIIKSFENLLYHEELVDVTLSAEGQYVKAHKVLLSACSQYFRDLFQSVPSHNHPIVFLRETRFEELKSLLCFIYHGEVNVAQENLPFLLNLAESLQVKGLAQERTCENMTFSQSSAGSRPSSCKIYPKERRDQSDPKNTKNKQRQTASPASPVNFSNLSALGTLLHTASAHKGHSGTPPTFNRPSPIHERNTPQHDIASPPHKSTQSPPSKRRKRTASPPNNSTHSNNMPSISPTEISSSPDRDESQAVNLSVAQAPQSPPPRLMVLKEELINKDEETPLQKDQRERLCNFFDKDSFAAGMMKLSGGNMDSEGEEEPPPPHEDENSGDIDSHGGSIPGLPLHHSLQQQFVPYPPSSLAGHHFPNFNPGTSVAHSGTGVPKWRSHSTEHTPSSPQGVHPVFKDLLCGEVGASTPTNTSAHSGGSVSKKAVPTPCPICNKVLSNAYNMRVHLETHQDITYKCLICGIVTRTRDTMRKHLSNVHKLRNIQLKNSFKKITGKGENENSNSFGNTPVKCSKSPPPLLTPSQALAAKAMKSSHDQFTPKRDVKSNLKAALTSGLSLTNHIPPTSLQPDMSSIASMTSSTINEVTAAAVASFFPSLANVRALPQNSPSPPPISAAQSLFGASPSGESESTIQGNKLASIVNKLNQNNEMKF